MVAATITATKASAPAVEGSLPTTACTAAVVPAWKCHLQLWRQGHPRRLRYDRRQRRRRRKRYQPRIRFRRRRRFRGGIFNLDGTVHGLLNLFEHNSVKSGVGWGHPGTDGSNLYNLAYGREWRPDQRIKPGGPVLADMELRGTKMDAGPHSAVNNLDSSAHSTSGTGNNAAWMRITYR